VDACTRDLGIKVGQTTSDMKFTLEIVRCLGCCGLAAVMTVNDDVHGHVSSTKIPRILKQYKRTERENHGEANE
jgi:NADH:ubiquinone oxidoreductase subunit E